MHKICNRIIEEVRYQDSDKLSFEEKLIISRALRNINPDAKDLQRSTKKSVLKFLGDAECHAVLNESGQNLLSDCDCSENSSSINLFCEAFKSKRLYEENELQHFVDTILNNLNSELNKTIVYKKCNKCSTEKDEFCIVPVLLRRDDERYKSLLFH